MSKKALKNRIRKLEKIVAEQAEQIAELFVVTYGDSGVIGVVPEEEPITRAERERMN